MELIKKIKQAETQAQEIIDQAKAQALSQAEQARQKRRQATTDAETNRKKAIASAVDRAAADGQNQLDALKAEAEADRRRMRDNTQTKMAAAVEKVLEYLKG